MGALRSFSARDGMSSPRLWLNCRVPREFPQHPDLAAMLGLVLHQVVEDPLRRHVVVGEVARAAELLDRHPAEGRQQPVANGVQPPQVLVETDALDPGEATPRVAVRARQERRHLVGIRLLLQDLDVEPVGLDQGEVVEDRADAVAAFGRRPVDRPRVDAD